MEALKTKLMTMDNFDQYSLNEGIDLVLGLGASGYSCAQFLTRQNRAIRVADSRQQPPFAEQLNQVLPDIDVHLGDFVPSLLNGVVRVITSPGIPTHDALLVEAQHRQIPIVSDIQLFAEVAPAPVIAITGSNGKSTVTSWFAHVLNSAGKQALSGGNLGTPALELLDEEIPDYYVLELSSFQLERTSSLSLKAAAILNMGIDHVDHHGSLQAYHDAKWKILKAAENVVVHASLATAARERLAAQEKASVVKAYGNSDDADSLHYTLVSSDEGAPNSRKDVQLCRNGQSLLHASDLKLVGHHNYLNALAVIALADMCELAWPATLAGLTTFSGLPHRMEWVGERSGVTWINDSKGTNADATIAAVRSLHTPLVLIAGGDSKAADFSELANTLADPTLQVRAVVVIGIDAGRLERAIAGRLPVLHAASMEQAVLRSASTAIAGDTVLLSPACASFDMFDNYQHRGHEFICAWRELV